MNVTRVHTQRGSHIEPPLDPNWDNLTKLRWHAAVVAHETGLTVEVEPQPEASDYSVTIVGSSSAAAYTYREAWVYLSGIGVGHGAALDEHQEQP
ncbi:hypothetical protein ACFUJR_39305, partial [Streptomyces sp. NPDC057271]|uniref:hypothetical protein n=1 Tax=unclassified Streptomyces TaxID=2593676 RepID=UPI00362DF426